MNTHWFLALIFSAFLFFVNAQNAQQQQQQPQPAVVVSPAKGSASTVNCIQCNSDNTGEKDCDSSDANVLAKYIKSCPKITDGEFTNTAATSCRKIIQNVVDDRAIIRECAYSGEAVDGKRKTGNKGIILYYYQCFNEDNNKPCNSASYINLNLFGMCLAYIAFKLTSMIQ